MQLLATRNICKSFGTVKALTDVSIELNEGELLSVVGENGAGKSTLMNVINGIYQPDSGEIYVNGQRKIMNTPLDAIRAGISIVHQELVNCPDITVAENIFTSSIIRQKRFLVDFRELNRKAGELLGHFDGRIDPRERMGNLTISEQQIVEIAKAMSVNAKIIVFDEPTSSLMDDEVKKLFQIIAQLKAQGIGILYISHRMSEIFALSDRVSILRDGVLIDTLPIDRLTHETIVSKMTGRTIGNYCPPKETDIGEAVFEISGYCRPGVFRDISVKLYKGEILGFSGLIGAGRSELMKSVVGIEPFTKGVIRMGGETFTLHRYAEALRRGIVYLTENRKNEGLFLDMDVQQNMSILNLSAISGRIFVNEKLSRREAQKYSGLVNLKCSGLHQQVGTLSGGNQQKIMVGNALSIEPRIIILDEPTKGIDVGAKAEIYAHLRELARQGVGIIVISSDLPEVIGLCDRAVIMYEGRLCGEVRGEDMNEQTILHKAAGF